MYPAYCLMTNHIHLLLETGDMEIWKFMKYMSECYAIYLKAKVTGHSLYLFTVMQEISLYKFKDYNDRFGHKYVL